MIGEYLGRLMPLDHVSPNNNNYIYSIEDHAECDAGIYGNVSLPFQLIGNCTVLRELSPSHWKMQILTSNGTQQITRYINHHCNCNTEPEIAMYGRRAVMTFTTNRFIAAGEEVTIDYGPEYFNANFPCQCDAFDYPHTSEVYRRRVHPDGSVSSTGIGTYGEAKGKRGSNEAGGGVAADGSSVEETWTRKTRAGQAKVKKTQVKNAKVIKPRVEKMRVKKTRLTRMRVPKIMLKTTKKASAPKVGRHESWGARAYKGGDPGRNPLRRSARIAAIGLRA